MLSHEDAERKMEEFHKRLNELARKNPNLRPDSLEVLQLINEFQKQGLPIQIVSENDMKKAAQNLMKMLNQMGNPMNPDCNELDALQNKENQLCKYQKKELDTTNRTIEISKKEVTDLAIDFETLDDSVLWEKYFGIKETK
jgi:hypothetical protein